MEEESREVADGSPATEGALGSNGGSDDESDALGDGVGLLLSGSPVLAGGSAELLGRDAGLAATGLGVARSDTVVGSAGVRAGAGVGRAGEVDRSNASGSTQLADQRERKYSKYKGQSKSQHNMTPMLDRE